MLVDDSASFRMAAEQSVTEVCGTHVIGQADSGEAAIEMALRLRPQVILMDLAMGESMASKQGDASRLRTARSKSSSSL
jgi:DNA-binding NarL/FixJ family response regulator